MPRRLSIQEHLSIDELERNYRATYDPIERTRYQIIWLLAKGKTTKEVSSVTGYCLEAIRQIARRYNRQGKEGLVDRRHQHPGQKGFLSDERQAHLEMALQEKAPDGGLWNGRKVGDWLTELIDHRVDRRRGWEYLRSMKYRLRIPRPQHQKSATPTEQEKWKKNSLTDLNN